MKALKQLELNRRELSYRGNLACPFTAKSSSSSIRVSPRSTMRAAVMATRQREPAKVVVAIPVSSIEACDRLMVGADEVVCVQHLMIFPASGNGIRISCPRRTPKFASSWNMPCALILSGMFRKIRSTVIREPSFVKKTSSPLAPRMTIDA